MPSGSCPHQIQPHSCIKVLAQIITQTRDVATQSRISLSSVLAVIFSWARNRSILWAILAGVFSWFYVIYFALTRRPDEMRH